MRLRYDSFTSPTLMLSSSSVERIASCVVVAAPLYVIASAIATDSGETNRLGSVSCVSAVACLSSLIAKRLSASMSRCSCGVSARGSAVIRVEGVESCGLAGGVESVGLVPQPSTRNATAIAGRRKRFMTASLPRLYPYDCCARHCVAHGILQRDRCASRDLHVRHSQSTGVRAIRGRGAAAGGEGRPLHSALWPCRRVPPLPANRSAHHKPRCIGVCGALHRDAQYVAPGAVPNRHSRRRVRAGHHRPRHEALGRAHIGDRRLLLAQLLRSRRGDRTRLDRSLPFHLESDVHHRLSTDLRAGADCPLAPGTHCRRLPPGNNSHVSLFHREAALRAAASL